MDNYLSTAETDYYTESADKLVCDMIETFPKYTIFDASFLTNGNVNVVSACSHVFQLLLIVMLLMENDV